MCVCMYVWGVWGCSSVCIVCVMDRNDLYFHTLSIGKRIEAIFLLIAQNFYFELIILMLFDNTKLCFHQPLWLKYIYINVHIYSSETISSVLAWLFGPDIRVWPRHFCPDKTGLFFSSLYMYIICLLFSYLSGPDKIYACCSVICLGQTKYMPVVQLFVWVRQNICRCSVICLC